LGIAFQIADDVLDIWGEERVTGKSLGTDLEKQKLTLPIIHMLKRVEPTVAATVRGLLSKADPELRRRLRPHLETTGALDYAWQCAKQHAKRAGDSLDCLADSDAKTVLRSLAYYVVRRAS
jgi:octaprenyl-diphosphate synthase